MRDVPAVGSVGVPVDNKLRGSSGEHLVCGVLAQFGWAAALTRDGVARTDVLAVEADTGRTITVQVKTTWCETGQLAKWALGMKDILPAMVPTEWYVLVKLEGLAQARARYFVVPRDHVAAGAWIAHQDWLTDPAAEPGRRNASQAQARLPQEVVAEYEDRWTSPGTPAYEVPVMLPAWCKDRCREERVGLPPDHPWQGALPKSGNWA